ncbi:hypothetical protein SNEBB_010991 [Seison nebaliae]|nr:hypothetical protein SNEBB_010991 [Seison nebaliae]
MNSLLRRLSPNFSQRRNLSDNIDMNSLSKTEKMFMKKASNINRNRGEQVQNSLKKNRRLGIGLSVSIILIFSYTIFMMKDSNYLGNFNEPEEILKGKKNQN